MSTCQCTCHTLRWPGRCVVHGHTQDSWHSSWSWCSTSYSRSLLSQSLSGVCLSLCWVVSSLVGTVWCLGASLANQSHWLLFPWWTECRGSLKDEEKESWLNKMEEVDFLLVSGERARVERWYVSYIISLIQCKKEGIRELSSLVIRYS